MKDLTPERLTRLLALITYLADGRRVPFHEAAEHFGVTEEQLVADIDTLWVSGAPGYSHAELIDFEASAYDDGHLALREAQQMDRPLRLSPAEAITLLVALNSLIARLGQNEVLASTRAKLETAAGTAVAAANAVHISHTPQDKQALRLAIEDAIAGGTQLRLRYVSGLDVQTERTVDPVVLQATDEHWLLGAWCHLAGAPRQFRLDRIIELQALPTPISPESAGLTIAPLDTSQFDHHVTLTLASSARWVTEQIPVESVTDEGETFAVVIASPDPQWLDQLCLRLGDALISVHPAPAAARVRASALSALALYGK